MGKMVDVWPSIIEDDRAREMRFKMRRWKKSTEKANILQKEKDQVKTNFKVIICCLSKKGGKDNSIYIFPCFIVQKIILYETIEYAMRAYAQFMTAQR